jgi:hypothetical protein
MSVDAAAPGPPVRSRHHLRGLSHGRLPIRRAVAVFGLTFALIVGVGAALTAGAAPSSHPVCRPFHPCAVPPRVVRPLVSLSVWRSPASAVSLEYDGTVFGIARQDGAGVWLGIRFKDGTSGLVIVRAEPGGSPAAAIGRRIDALKGTVTQLARDNSPADQLLGAGVGLRSGSGAVYKGVLAGPQGVSQSDVVAIESASAGGVTITATVVAPASHSGSQSGLYSLADQVINSVKWPAGAS